MNFSYKFPVFQHEFRYIKNQNVPSLIHDFQYIFEDFLYKNPNSKKMLQNFKMSNISIINKSIYLYKIENIKLIKQAFSNYLHIRTNEYDKINYESKDVKELLLLNILIYRRKYSKYFKSNNKQLCRNFNIERILKYEHITNKMIINNISYNFYTCRKKILLNDKKKFIIYKRKFNIYKRSNSFLIKDIIGRNMIKNMKVIYYDVYRNINTIYMRKNKGKLINKFYRNNLMKYNNSMKYLINNKIRFIYYNKGKDKYFNLYIHKLERRKITIKFLYDNNIKRIYKNKVIVYLNNFYPNCIYKNNDMFYFNTNNIKKLYKSISLVYLIKDYKSKLYISKKTKFIYSIQKRRIYIDNSNFYLSKSYVNKINKNKSVIFMTLNGQKEIYISNLPKLSFKNVYCRSIIKNNKCFGLYRYYDIKLYINTNIKFLYRYIYGKKIIHINIKFLYNYIYDKRIIHIDFIKSLYNYFNSDMYLNNKSKLINKFYRNNLMKYNNSMKYLINNSVKLIYYKKDESKYYNKFTSPIYQIKKYRFNKYLLNFHRMNIDIIDTQKFLYKIYKSSILKNYKKYYLELKSNKYQINKNIFSSKYVERFVTNVTKENFNKYLGSNCYYNIDIIQEKRKYLKKNVKLLLKNTNKQQKWLSKPIWKQILKSEGKTKFLDLKPTWYIIESDGLTDILIIPNIDYPYESEAVGDINKHPISSIIDINYNDINYGVDKIAVSIKVMQQMLNFLFVIWNGKVTDFSDILATEAIEQTITAFYNWLNISKVQEEMDSKNVREDYLRVYRWFRWEAEKVWIEEYNTEDTGLKGVGMLVANIIKYMKNHHYNIVPITNRNYLFELSDILRAFTIKFVDYYKNPEKTKGYRNYYLRMKK